MFPPIFAVCAAYPAVTAILGTNPVRLYPFGEAPEQTPKPYAVWQTISGSPENYLGDAPDMDQYSLQIDVYGDTATQVRDAAKALRNAIEPAAYVTRWGGESRETVTKLYRYMFEVSWMINR